MPKSEKSAEPTDLFGHPWVEPKDPRGRKPHVRSEEVAKKIALSRATGATIEQVVVLSGLSEPTLRKYYFRELDKAPEIVEAMVDEAIFTQAMAGRVGAQRLLKEMLAKGKANVPLQRTKAAPRAKPAAQAKLGKKAQRDLDAQTADQGTGWAKILN